MNFVLRERRSLAGFLGAVCVGAAVCLPAQASAEPSAAASPSEGHAVAKLILEGAEPRCPSTAELVARVNQLMNREAVANEHEDVRVYWTIEELEGGLTARFRLVTRDDQEIGARSVHSIDLDCTALRDRFALVLALMLDLPAEKAAPPPEAAPPVQRWMESELGSTLSIGWLPQPRAGVELAFRLELWRHVPVALGVTWWPTSRFETESGDYELHAWTATLLAGPAILERPWGRIGMGVGGRLGLLGAQGLGFPSNSSSSALIVDAAAEMEAAVRLAGLLWMRGATGPLVPLVRPRVVFLDGARREVEIHRAGFAHGFATVSLVAHF